MTHLPAPLTRDELLDDLVAYEAGLLDEDATSDLFQHLVDTGLAWQLQGHYGRTAIGLLDAGLITAPKETDR